MVGPAAGVPGALRMITWKRVGFLALAVPAVLLLAFGPRGQREVPKGVVVVEYWEKWTGNERDQLMKSVDDFNATVGKQKGIYVNCLSTSGIVQKTLMATAGGVPPDIAGLWDPGIPQFAALDALEPLDDLAAAHGITADTYKKVFWDECHYAGKLYALVSTPYCYVLHYNTEIFRQNADKLRAAGLDPTRAPRTIDEIDAYAKALDVINPDGSIARTGYLPFEPGWDLSYLCYQFGGQWWDEKTRSFTFTDPKVMETYRWMRGYAERLGDDAVSSFQSGTGNYDSPQNAFLSGTTAIVSQGTFFAQVIHHQKPSMDGQWAAAPLPVKSPDLGNVTSCTADVLCVPRGAKHKKEAFEFIAWLQEQKHMEALCNNHCKISPLAKVSDDFLHHHNNPYISVFEEAAASPGARGTPSIETMAQVAEELTNLKLDIATLRTTPEKGLAEVQQRCQAYYDNFQAKQALYVK